jgi:putative endopeptidase
MSSKHLLAAAAASFLLTAGAPAVEAGEGQLDQGSTPVVLVDEAESETAAVTVAATRYGEWGIDLDGMDPSVKAGDDFFRYVNGKWAANTEIPPDRTRFGAFDILRDLSEERVRAILDRWAADDSLKAGSDEEKVAIVYRTFLDEKKAEELGRSPIDPHLKKVLEAKDHADVVRLMAWSHGRLGRSFFGASVFDDAKNPEQYALYISQSGIGLRDREFYLRDNFRPQKERYQQYVADMLRLAGWDKPDESAAAVVEMETRIAEAHWTRAESRNRDKTYNPMTVEELEDYAQGFPWKLYFEEAGLGKAGRAIVRQNTALPKMTKLFAETPLDTLKAWAAFHTTDNAAPLLSSEFVNAHWEFRSKFLNGAEEQRPRWKRAVDASEDALGEAIGRTYVAEYFPPESKAMMEELVGNLRLAMKARIEELEWMGPETKKLALEKLSKFGLKIGYPSKWRDYSGLEVNEGDLVGNAERSAAFEWDFRVNRIGKPVDDDEWGMTPQTVNAYYSSTKNEIVFPAAILQPPFFDPKADPSVNYGAIGGVIGHEITHGFDDQGRKSDGDGVLRDWWAAEDAEKF